MDRKINLNLNIKSIIPEAKIERSETIEQIQRIGEEFLCKSKMIYTPDEDDVESICLHEESFIHSDKAQNVNTYTNFDYSYLQICKSRALALVGFLKSNKLYKKWSKNWDFLEYNLDKNDYYFGRLNSKHSDVAHVIDKGKEIGFRIRDSSGLYVPLNVFQYVLYHEMAHMATSEYQHTQMFWKLLSIMCFAAFEMALWDFEKLRKFHGYYNSNGQPILSLKSIKSEIAKGIEHVKNENKDFQSALYLKLLEDS